MSGVLAPIESSVAGEQATISAPPATTLATITSRRVGSCNFQGYALAHVHRSVSLRPATPAAIA